MTDKGTTKRRVIQGQELRDELLGRVRAQEDRGHRKIGLAIDTDGQEHEVRPATARSAETEEGTEKGGGGCIPGKVECEWADMNAKQQGAVRMLGWTEKSWTDGEDLGPGSGFERPWSSLEPAEKGAALLLGYDDTNFDKYEGEGEGEEEGEGEDGAAAAAPTSAREVAPPPPPPGVPEIILQELTMPEIDTFKNIVEWASADGKSTIKTLEQITKFSVLMAGLGPNGIASAIFLVMSNKNSHVDPKITEPSLAALFKLYGTTQEKGIDSVDILKQIDDGDERGLKELKKRIGGMVRISSIAATELDRGQVRLVVTEGGAGFACNESLVVTKVQPGSRAAAAGVNPGMKCAAMQDRPLAASMTWTTLKAQVKQTPKPWTFIFVTADADAASAEWAKSEINAECDKLYGEIMGEIEPWVEKDGLKIEELLAEEYDRSIMMALGQPQGGDIRRHLAALSQAEWLQVIPDSSVRTDALSYTPKMGEIIVNYQKLVAQVGYSESMGMHALVVVPSTGQGAIYGILEALLAIGMNGPLIPEPTNESATPIASSFSDPSQVFRGEIGKQFMKVFAEPSQDVYRAMTLAFILLQRTAEGEFFRNHVDAVSERLAPFFSESQSLQSHQTGFSIMDTLIDATLEQTHAVRSAAAIKQIQLLLRRAGRRHQELARERQARHDRQREQQEERHREESAEMLRNDSQSGGRRRSKKRKSKRRKSKRRRSKRRKSKRRTTKRRTTKRRRSKRRRSTKRKRR